MLQTFKRWLQLTFLFSIVFFAMTGLVMAPVTQGDWSRFAVAGALGAVLALLVARRLGKSAQSVKEPAIPAAQPAAARASGNGYTGYTGHAINPASGLPMAFDDDFGPDVGGNLFGTTSAFDDHADD